VEAVIQAHVDAFIRAGFPVTVIAGRGDAASLSPGADFVLIPEIDSQHPKAEQMNSRLERGEVPPDFDQVVNQLVGVLAPTLVRFDNVIIHNVFTKHFNLPLTAALHYLLDAGELKGCIAWCHDFSWTSDHSRSKLHPGHPWDLLRVFREDVAYVVVSRRRQKALAALLGCPHEQIRVVYNGVDPRVLLGLSNQGFDLVNRLGLLESDLNLLMPVRVTQAKNIEYALHVLAALKTRAARPKLILTGPPDPHDSQSMIYFRSLQGLRQQLGVVEEMRFVFESGPNPEEPYPIGMQAVGDLFRVSDVMFMPSHREGFGMPILEAGLVGVPVVCTPVPAADEIGLSDVAVIDANQEPARVADQILARVAKSPVHRLRRRVRQHYTWHAIFHRDIEPLLAGKGAVD